MAEDHTHAKAADVHRKGKYTTGWIYSILLFPLIELSVVFGVAGWVTYLQKEKGAPAGGGAGAEPEDDKEGATPERSDAEGSDGQ